MSCAGLIEPEGTESHIATSLSTAGFSSDSSKIEHHSPTWKTSRGFFVSQMFALTVQVSRVKDCFMGEAICKENAKELGLLGAKLRWQKWREEKLARELAESLPKPKPQEQVEADEASKRKERILKQIDMLDKDFKDADTATRIKLTIAKARLWELVHPKPGSLRPNTKPARSRPADFDPPQPSSSVAHHTISSVPESSQTVSDTLDTQAPAIQPDTTSTDVV